MNALHVHMLPSLMQNVDLRGANVVVIDILRATTTMTRALSEGAREIIPCLTVEQALETAASLPAGTALLGGERGGQRIEGFDLDNSPFGYSRDVVEGKSIVFTTTNGTKALLQCRDAAKVFIGAFTNRQAIVQQLQRDSQTDIHLVCAGTDGQLTAEDILYAGALTADLTAEKAASHEAANVQAQMARDFFLNRSVDRATFQIAFEGSLGGQNLKRLKMDRDIEFAMTENLYDITPLWNPHSNRISI